MPDRPLTPDEAALWARVLETVRPIRVVKPIAAKPSPANAGAKVVNAGNKVRRMATPASATEPRPAPGKARGETVDLAKMLKAALDAPPGRRRATPPVAVTSSKPAGGKEHATLDGSWDRQLSRGLISPDRTIDLHGHNLSTAYATLDSALDRAIREGDRVILLVTGKPPRAESERPHAPKPFRGAIRAAIGDWLAGSRHATAIAAVRGAHPRHGGSGALYIILRRSGAPRKN